MRAWRIEQVRAMARSWSHLPEGGAGAPRFIVPFTPAALVLFMEANGIMELDADLVTDQAPVFARQIADGGQDATRDENGALRGPVPPTGRPG